MKASDLKSVLRDLSELFRSSGSARAAEDVNLLTSRLQDEDGKPAAEAIEMLERELIPPKPVRLFAQRYVAALKEAGLDEEAFDRVLDELKADKMIKKADLIEVMQGYAGAHSRARSIKEAFEVINRKFSRLLFDENARRQASSTPW